MCHYVVMTLLLRLLILTIATIAFVATIAIIAVIATIAIHATTIAATTRIIIAITLAGFQRVAAPGWGEPPQENQN